MNIISNEKLIRRNSRIAQVAGLGGLIVLMIGIYFLFTKPNEITIIWGTVIAGFILSQVGIFFTNRWGRVPRPDQHLNSALKGLDSNYSIYHYSGPTPHLLVGPAGIWALITHYQRGTIMYERGRYRQKGGGFVLGYLKIFGQEGIGRPDLEVEGEKEAVTKFLKKKMPDKEIPPVQAALVFTDERATLETDDAPIPTVTSKKLKEFIRKAAKSKPLSPIRIQEVREALEGTTAIFSSTEDTAESDG
jgi:hypothetical protein